MHKLKQLIVIILLAFICNNVLSDEGMWIPGFIPQGQYQQMYDLGLKIDSEAIYSYNQPGLTDAVFQLQSARGSGFCTAEAVSANGLLFTNHHCIYSAVVNISTVENNYIDNGFWARSTSEEISLKGIRASRVVKIKDVTSKVLANISDTTSQKDRSLKIADNIEEIEAEYIDNENYSVRVRPMFQGLQYYLFYYEVFGDIRLVGLPENSIGKFGGDTDNWMWPRHTGDFAIMRIYADENGKPTSEYNENNIPYQPNHHFPISIRGIQKNDFAMVIGFPGRTERFITSYGMKYKRDYYNPGIIAMFGAIIDVLEEEMQKDDKVRLAYSNIFASIANGHKSLKGENLALLNTDVIDKQKEYENFIRTAIDDNEDLSDKYSEIFSKYQNLYKDLGPAANEMPSLHMGLNRASGKISKAVEFHSFVNLLENRRENKELIKDLANEYLSSIDKDYENYFPKVDEKIFRSVISTYLDFFDKDIHNKVFDEFIYDRYSGFFLSRRSEEEMIDNFIDDIYENSIFTCQDRMRDFLESPSLRILSRDPLYIYSRMINENSLAVSMRHGRLSGEVRNNERLYIEALKKIESEKDFYPDANSTLRLNYGTVQPYCPRDAVKYKHVTYIDGVIEKKDPDHHEFIVPEKLVSLYKAKKFGRYVDNTGNLPVNFITDNDITGGNSGSPVLNNSGELIGIAFDGNWEWLCSDLVFSPELQRSISVDIRYVLWVIDKVYNANNIIEELDIVF